MVRILGEDPEAGEDAAMSPSKRWTEAGQSLVGRSPSSVRSQSLNKVRPMAFPYCGILWQGVCDIFLSSELCMQRRFGLLCETPEDGRWLLRDG